MPVFENNENGYLDWINANPMFFVLNTNRSANPNYLILHRSTCRSISTSRLQGAYTERGYIKICSENEDGLGELLRHRGHQLGGGFRRCKKCNP